LDLLAFNDAQLLTQQEDFKVLFAVRLFPKGHYVQEKAENLSNYKPKHSILRLYGPLRNLILSTATCFDDG